MAMGCSIWGWDAGGNLFRLWQALCCAPGLSSSIEIWCSLAGFVHGTAWERWENQWENLEHLLVIELDDGKILTGKPYIIYI